MYDLRSDTVTRPTEGMRKAMYEAEVGDDVFGEDPTVLRLQARVADLLGKEAALFVPSGTMGNQIALAIQTQPGDEVIVERTMHVFNYESGAGGLISGVQFNVLDGANGVLSAAHIERALRPGYYWEPRSRLIWLENTLNKAGGVVYPLDTIHEITVLAKQHNLGLHLDGARLWNASAASGVLESAYAAPFDTVNVCLSKGLGAPIGSVLAGSTETIQQAHRMRKVLGGGMRQVGVLAAAGLYALDYHRARLAQDHANAQRLAEGIAELPAFSMDDRTVETNIVMFDTVGREALDVLEEMKAHGIWMVPFGPATIRATTHLDMSSNDIDAVLSTLRRIFHPTTIATS
ncbi:MAG: GntG family PLP-dependent aldolase [Rhodothermales bacterium]